MLSLKPWGNILTLFCLWQSVFSIPLLWTKLQGKNSTLTFCWVWLSRHCLFVIFWRWRYQMWKLQPVSEIKFINDCNCQLSCFRTFHLKLSQIWLNCMKGLRDGLLNFPFKLTFYFDGVWSVSGLGLQASSGWSEVQPPPPALQVVHPTNPPADQSQPINQIDLSYWHPPAQNHCPNPKTQCIAMVPKSSIVYWQPL